MSNLYQYLIGLVILIALSLFVFQKIEKAIHSCTEQTVTEIRKVDQ